MIAQGGSIEAFRSVRIWIYFQEVAKAHRHIFGYLSRYYATLPDGETAREISPIFVVSL
jgi:hypothetical protein